MGGDLVGVGPTLQVRPAPPFGSGLHLDAWQRIPVYRWGRGFSGWEDYGSNSHTIR